MSFRLQKAAVLGSGVMGAGIACHLANIGMDVIMLDIVPFNLTDEQKQDPTMRNSLVNAALKSALKSKPASLFKKGFANRIETGNFDDDFEKIKDADWIIEVVIERLDIKQQIFEKVDQYRKPGSLVSSNTSSIPIRLLADGRSDDFKSHFCGTHFFNPPRYLRLLEIIPTADTSQDVIDFFMSFGDLNIGKQTVLCKDTTGFIGNRVGVMSMSKLDELTVKHKMTIEEVDALTGPLIGRPNTGTFRLQDLVGLDTGAKVTEFISNNTPGDEYYEKLKGKGVPKHLAFLLENKFLGNKTKKGFYEKTSERDEKGKRIVNALHLETLTYAPSKKPRLDIIGAAKNIERFDVKMKTLLDGDSRDHTFFKEYFAALFSYVACRVPEISDEYYPIDDALRTGYMWDYGPFEYWDALGFEEGIKLIESQGEAIPEWIHALKGKGFTSFYKYEDGLKKYFNLAEGKYVGIPGGENYVVLDALRSNTPIIKNAEATVHDLGDGVMCLEFTSKSNAIGEGIGEAMVEAIEIAERDGWKGIVVGNNGKNFTVGANLMVVGMLAMQKEFGKLEEMVHGFQQVNMRIRTSKIPVVVATQGYVFGGGCEITMHCDAAVAAAESYIGLVEVGVGLLPGGGGTKEMALRASDKYFDGDVMMPTLIDHFKSIATAAVATSAYEAFDLGYLMDNRDSVSHNVQRNIAAAKHKVLELAKNYIAPVERHDIKVLGRAGLSTLYSAINEFRLGEYMSDYDVTVAKEVAYVICGGDLTAAQEVSEQYLLDLEREGFLRLLGNQKTLDRIQYTLMNNKPLRN